jgi:hypothetical protein
VSEDDDLVIEMYLRKTWDELDGLRTALNEMRRQREASRQENGDGEAGDDV